MNVRILALGLALGLFLVLPSQAEAQSTRVLRQRDAQALRVYQAGETAFSEGNYASALQFFESAYELSHRPGILHNMGLCADRMRHDEDAIRWFTAYLHQAPVNAANRDEVERRLRALQEAEEARQAQVAPAASALPAPIVTTEATTEATSEMTGPVTNQAMNQDWLWGLIGGGAALVVGGIVVGIVVASQPQPEPGNLGGIVMALEGRM